MMKGALAIFVKTPDLSPVKTRLAASIGKAKAEEFFKLSVAAIGEVAKNVYDITKGDIQPFWAIAEEEGINNKMWKDFPRIFTGGSLVDGSGLGYRLHNVYQELLDSHDYVLLIGADSPQITPSLIIRAGKIASQEKTFVIGPTHDGGFYLFGSSEVIQKEIWINTQYSTENTLNELKAHLENLGSFSIFKTMQDLDCIEDLSVLGDEMKKEELLPKQKKFEQALRITME